LYKEFNEHDSTMFTVDVLVLLSDYLSRIVDDVISWSASTIQEVPDGSRKRYTSGRRGGVL